MCNYCTNQAYERCISISVKVTTDDKRTNQIIINNDLYACIGRNGKSGIGQSAASAGQGGYGTTTKFCLSVGSLRFHFV